jgi:hypothetical protein
MKYLLEFYNYEEFSDLKEIVNDIFLSEFDESMNIEIKKSIINCNLQFKAEKKSEFDFNCYLVTFDYKISKEDFLKISERLEKVILLEMDDEIKCFEVDAHRIEKFCIIWKKDFDKINAIYEFENSIEDAIYDIENNEYSPAINITFDSLNDWNNRDHAAISIWIRLFGSRLGLSLSMIKTSLDEKTAYYRLISEPVFNENRNLSNRYVSKINMNNIHPKIRKWIKNNIPALLAYAQEEYVNYNTINKIKEFDKKIDDLNLTFNLDLDSDAETESKRLISMIRDKVFPIFSNDFTKNLAKLYKEFKKLEEYNIDANWTNQGNYFFVFDINYKGKFYMLNVKFNTKTKNTVEIEFKDLDKKEEVSVSDFTETVYLYLEEN